MYFLNPLYTSSSSPIDWSIIIGGIAVQAVKYTSKWVWRRELRIKQSFTHIPKLYINILNHGSPGVLTAMFSECWYSQIGVKQKS